MDSPIEQLAVLGPRSPRPAGRASIAVRPRAAAIQLIGLIVLSIAAILAVVPSAHGMVIVSNLLICGRTGIG